jgi:hypothetical protein
VATLSESPSKPFEKYLTEFGMNSPVRNENASDPFEFSILRSYDNNRLQEFVEIN